MAKLQSPIHFLTATAEYVADEIIGEGGVGRVPAYAPELNPAESLWAWLKQQRLANVAESGIDRLARRVTDGTRNYRRRPLLLGAFLAKEAGLFL